MALHISINFIKEIQAAQWATFQFIAFFSIAFPQIAKKIKRGLIFRFYLKAFIY